MKGGRKKSGKQVLPGLNSESNRPTNIVASSPASSHQDLTEDIPAELNLWEDIKFGWEDVISLVILSGCAVLVSFIIGLFASASVSIHFYRHEFPRSPPAPLLFTHPFHSVTGLDPFIASSQVSNALYRSPKSGQQSYLPFVTVPRLYFLNRNPLNIHPPQLEFEHWTRIHPNICPDGKTFGFNNWRSLQAVIQEANLFSAESFIRWNEYYAKAEPFFTGVFEDSSLYYERDILITICPGATLRSRKGPIFINAENVLLECDDCTIDVGGTHLSFGPHARNVMIRGVFFKNALTSSVILHHDGAEVFFEDCRWVDNEAVSNKVGSVADVNSTSKVHFHRCFVGRRPNTSSRFVTALSIRAS